MNTYGYRGHRLQIHPSLEPVTLNDLKNYLRLSGASEDQELVALIEEARQLIEDYSGLALITQTWQLTIDRWPSVHEPWWDGVRQAHINILDGGNSSLKLPRHPLQSITSVTVYSGDGTPTTVTVGDIFDVDTQQLLGRLTLKLGAVWPVALRANNAIEIVYKAGYGDDTVDVPMPLVRAVKQLAAYLYSHRGDGCVDGNPLTKSGVASILDTYRVREI